MRTKLISLSIIILLYYNILPAQTQSRFIIVDQFGYLPDSKKIAVLKDPQTGFDASESFIPGSSYSVVKATTGERVFTSDITLWGNGITDASSGDKVWHFDFSTVTEPGRYYILDEEKNLKSYEFIISHNVYTEILRQAMRTFFYQRAGFKKEEQYTGEGWVDSASHIGNLQDKNCRDFFDKANADLEKDVSGGWYDAGDYNKYTNWTANYIVEMMKAYIEKPEAWADDYNIPESGNGIPDILDEAKWGIDHLLRMQQQDGSVLSIVGESHASPPSAATGPSYYGPASTSSTLNTAAAFAISSKVYRSINNNEYADTLLLRALKAWEWAEENPAVIFNNNNSSNNSLGLGAGNQEVSDYDRAMIKLEAACYLFEVTGDIKFRDYFDMHYLECHLIQWYWAYPFEALNQEVLLYYSTLGEGTDTVQSNIKNIYKDAVINGSDNLAAYKNKKDPYLAYIKDYTWGSNSVKSAQANMYYNLITYNIDETSASTARDAALTFIYYINGVNPLNFVYLSNMYKYGADYGVNEFYHSWFCNKSPLWDRVGVSVYGPPPGYLTGGPNPSYNWAGCCPGSCGSTDNNKICTSESISPPKNQPTQKSYKDFNTSWPLNSWEVTENSCGYQVNYIRLLSKFVTVGRDCNGDENGTAFFDSCSVCAGGNTGITPVLDKNVCGFPVDCNGDEGGIAFIDSCGICAGGNTGIVPVLDTNECFVPTDCNGDENGLAVIDSCGICSGGNTGITPILDTAECSNTFLPEFTAITNPDFHIYPNPNDGILYVDCNEKSSAQVIIIDLVGKIVLKEYISGNSTTINTSYLTPGYYEIAVINNSKIFRQKFIIN